MVSAADSISTRSGCRVSTTRTNASHNPTEFHAPTSVSEIVRPTRSRVSTRGAWPPTGGAAGRGIQVDPHEVDDAPFLPDRAQHREADRRRLDHDAVAIL